LSAQDLALIGIRTVTARVARRVVFPTDVRKYFGLFQAVVTGLHWQV